MSSRIGTPDCIAAPISTLVQLFAADLSKSEGRGGNHKFVADAWLPADAIRGELAEKWEWQENPLAVVVTLRKGVMFPEKPGVMASRELTADDVVYAFDRVNTSPQNARGFDNAFRELSTHQVGSIAVLVTGLALVVYGVFCALIVRHLDLDNVS